MVKGDGDAMTAHTLSTFWVEVMAIFDTIYGQKCHLISGYEQPWRPQWLDQGLDPS